MFTWFDELFWTSVMSQISIEKTRQKVLQSEVYNYKKFGKEFPEYTEDWCNFLRYLSLIHQIVLAMGSDSLTFQFLTEMRIRR
jgi:hypothetical protein